MAPSLAAAAKQDPRPRRPVLSHRNAEFVSQQQAREIRPFVAEIQEVVTGKQGAKVTGSAKISEVHAGLCIHLTS